MKTSKFDLRKTLQQLEEENQQQIIPPERIPLVGRENELGRKSIKELSIDDIRFLINQKIGLILLIPIAIEILRENPFISGDRYEGDLLNAVLSVNLIFWQEHPSLYEEVDKILRLAESIETEEAINSLAIFLSASIYDFRKLKRKVWAS